MVSWIIECRKYAGKNRLETQETQERETLVDETEEEEKIEVPHFSYSTASRLSSRTANLIYALTYFVSPNAGLLVVHGTSATSSPGLFPQPLGTRLGTSGTTKEISNFSVQFYAGGTRLELILFHEFETSRTHDVLFGFVVLEFEKYRCTFARKTEQNNAKIYC